MARDRVAAGLGALVAWLSAGAASAGSRTVATDQYSGSASAIPSSRYSTTRTRTPAALCCRPFSPGWIMVRWEKGLDRLAASSSEIGRFETEWLSSEANLAALTDLSGAWIDRVHARRSPDGIILDMDIELRNALYDKHPPVRYHNRC